MVSIDFAKDAEFSMRSFLLSVLTACTLCVSSQALSDEYALPEIGTAGVVGLTVQREMQLGQYFLRQAHASLPIIGDPVMNEYLNSIGSKLLLAAKGVRFPFTFLTISNQTLNASAFLGGIVQVNTGLYHYADTEDEFASVLAHEISHVTQRHIARFIEAQIQTSTLSAAGIIGSIVMSIINPAVGMAALSTTVGAQAQSRINFTRDNEYEADRAGIDLLYRAGFNPFGMADMFRLLLAKQGNINPSFAMLIDHPLSEIRVSEAESRASQLGRRKNSTNVNYDLARARVDVRYMGVRDFHTLKQSLEVNPFKRSEAYTQYALALTCYELKQYDEAYSHLNRLNNLSNNVFVLDLKTDLDLATNKASAAVARLEAPYRKSPNNEALALNLANAYKEAGRPQNAVKVLNDFLKKNPDNVDALSLLTQSALDMHDRCTALQSRGRQFALTAQYPQALNAYSQAMNYCASSYDRDIIRARIAKTSEQRSFDEEIEKNMR